MGRAVTPSDLTITPRDLRFGRNSKPSRWWMDGDAVATAFYNALSATFPKGEGFFVESVRKFREGAPSKLEAEIKAFVTQEVMHSREHVQFNKRALEEGFGVGKAVGPGRIGEIADDPLVADRLEERRGVLLPAGPKQQSFRSREHDFSPSTSAAGLAPYELRSGDTFVREKRKGRGPAALSLTWFSTEILGPPIPGQPFLG